MGQSSNDNRAMVATFVNRVDKLCSLCLFSLVDFADQTDEDQLNALGFQLLAGSKVTLLASKTSREYPDQLRFFT